MDNVIKLLKQSPYIIVIVVLGYFGKLYVENQINSVNVKINEISKSSLGIKQDLRGEERQALIDFRVALEHWEHFLFSSLTNFSTRKITSQSINDYYEKEGQLQLEVKVAVAKLGIILQHEDVYLHAHPIIISISGLYHPFVNKYLPILIDLQAELEPIEYRMKQFDQNLKNGSKFEFSLEQAMKDKERNHLIQVQMTEVIQQYSDELLVIYPKVAEQLADLKTIMNEQVYRPITSDRLDLN